MSSPHPGAGTDCDEEQLAAYGAGELGPEDRSRMAAHLLDCEMCWRQSLTSRAVVAAVQRLWEPAPASLRADLRAAFTEPARRPRPLRSLTAVAAATAMVALIISGVIVATTAYHRDVATAKPAPPLSAAPAELPDRVRAAIAVYTAAMPSSGRPTTVPDLTSIGLRLTSAGAADIAGTSSTCFTYSDPNNLRVGVLVTATPWPRPAAAQPITVGVWATESDGLTLLGGADKAGDQMLVIAADHTIAMTTAAHLEMI